MLLDFSFFLYFIKIRHREIKKNTKFHLPFKKWFVSFQYIFIWGIYARQFCVKLEKEAQMLNEKLVTRTLNDKIHAKNKNIYSSKCSCAIPPIRTYLYWCGINYDREITRISISVYFTCLLTISSYLETV